MGGWGFRLVCSTLLLYLQPFATFRKCPRATVVKEILPCLWQVLQKRSLLEVSNVAKPRFGWQTWHFETFHATCFIMCPKLLCVTNALFLQDFQKISYIFCGRRNTLETSIIICSWQAQHFRSLVLRVFCASYCQGCVKWCQRANSMTSVGHRKSVTFRSSRSVW